MSILRNKLSLVSVSATLAMLLSACGGQPASIPSIANTQASGTASTAATTTTSTAITAVTQAPTSYSKIPFAFDLTGSSGGSNNSSSYLPACTNTSNQYNPSCEASGFSTDNHLNVNVTAQAYGWISDQQNSGYTVGFNCVQFNITVKPKGSASGGRTASVLVSTTGQRGTGSCAGAMPNPSLDFSDQVGSGHKAVEVDVQPMNYDNCRYYGNISMGGCPLNNVYYTHVIPGSVSVEIDS